LAVDDDEGELVPIADDTDARDELDADNDFEAREEFEADDERDADEAPGAERPSYDGAQQESPARPERTPAEPTDIEGPDDISMTDELAKGPTGPDKCPTVKDHYDDGGFKRMDEITNELDPDPGEFPQECPLGGDEYEPRKFAMTTFTWKASALCHKPLYFEQVQVERYGHTFGPVVQPILCGAHFFISVPALPYKMGVESPWECVYALGYYRPGSCAPRTVGPIPISARGVVSQLGISTGLVYLFP
jgi:hypothetical protein